VLKTAAALVVFAAVLVLAAAIWLPDLAEHLAADQFAALGLPEATLEVRHLSLNSVHVANLNLAPDGSARVDDIGVAYSLASLTEGRIDRVEVTGVHITVRVTDGAIDLGTWALWGASSRRRPPMNRHGCRSSASRCAPRSSCSLSMGARFVCRSRPWCITWGILGCGSMRPLWCWVRPLG